MGVLDGSISSNLSSTPFRFFSFFQFFSIGIYSGADQPPVFIKATETAYSLNDVSPNSVVTVYRHNAIPYIAPLRWQNDTIAGTRYFVVHDVTMGEAADTGRSTGELVFSGGTVTLESYGDVWNAPSKHSQRPTCTSPAAPANG